MCVRGLAEVVSDYRRKLAVKAYKLSIYRKREKILVN
jgi:hypothetical protein